MSKRKHFLITYKMTDKGSITGREREVVEAESQVQASVNASQKAKCMKWELVRVEEIPPDQIDLVKKQVKDTRKMRYQDSIKR